MTGAQVQRALDRDLTRELARSLRGIPSLSSIRVRMACEGDRREREIVRPARAPIGPDETLVVVTTDFFARRAARDAISVQPAAALASAPLAHRPPRTARCGQPRDAAALGNARPRGVLRCQSTVAAHPSGPGVIHSPKVEDPRAPRRSGGAGSRGPR